MPQKKILILDDSITARLLFSLCFINLPEYEIIQSGEWKESIEIAISQKPFLIVLDYNMPEKNGVEVAQIMQAKGVKAHYVLLTANTQDYIIKEAEHAGFFDVLEKPITPALVLALMEKCS